MPARFCGSVELCVNPEGPPANVNFQGSVTMLFNGAFRCAYLMNSASALYRVGANFRGRCFVCR